MLLAFGVVCALLEARASGRGQVVDAAMVDGVALLIDADPRRCARGGLWRDEPGTNFLDSGAHFYEVYETSDGGHVAVGAIEPQFYAELLRLLGARPGRHAAVGPRALARAQGALRGDLPHADARRVGRDPRAAPRPARPPVLGLAEAPEHPHNVARGTFVDVDGVVQPAPAPRFSRTPGAIAHAPGRAPADAESVLAAWLR